MNLSGIDRHQPVPAEPSLAKPSQPGDEREEREEGKKSRERGRMCVHRAISAADYRTSNNNLSPAEERSVVFSGNFRDSLAATLAVIRSRCLFHEGKKRNESSPASLRTHQQQRGRATFAMSDTFVSAPSIFHSFRALGDLSPVLCGPVMRLC